MGNPVAGRPACDEGFDHGKVDLLWQIQCTGQPLLRERLRLDAQAFVARWVCKAYPPAERCSPNL